MWCLLPLWTFSSQHSSSLWVSRINTVGSGCVQHMAVKVSVCHPGCLHSQQREMGNSGTPHRLSFSFVQCLQTQLVLILIVNCVSVQLETLCILSQQLWPLTCYVGNPKEGKLIINSVSVLSSNETIYCSKGSCPAWCKSSQLGSSTVFWVGESLTNWLKQIPNVLSLWGLAQCHYQ